MERNVAEIRQSAARIGTIVAACLWTLNVAAATTLLPGMDPHPGRVSRTSWLWNAAEEVKAGGCSCFRATFDLSERPRRAELRIFFDDVGTVWANGRKLGYNRTRRTASESDLARALRPGRNVLALFDKNGGGPGGVLFLLRLEQTDGSVRYVVSDGNVRAVAEAPSGWTDPAFDDSRWPTAREQGDAMAPTWSCAPFARTGLFEAFLTDEERARYEADERRAFALPADFDAGPPPEAKVVSIGNMPMLRAQGRLFEPDWILSGARGAWARNAARRWAELGRELVQINLDEARYELGAGVYDFSELGREAEKLFSVHPNARVTVLLRLRLPKWLQEHPDEAIAYGTGPAVPHSDEHRGRPLCPSAASAAYRQEAGRAIAALGAYVNAQVWANRLVAVRAAWGTYGEWHVPGMWESPDVSRPMAEAFRRFADGRWATEDPPRADERATGKFLLDPVRDAKLVDFYLCQQEEVADLAASFARAVKTALPGRLFGIWYGYVLNAQAPEGSNVLLERMLANPDIDFLCDPPAYPPACRLAGGAFVHRTIPASFHRHGKLTVLEDDNRYDWIAPYEKPSCDYVMRSPAETRATVLRAYLSKLFDRGGIQYQDASPGEGGSLRPCLIDDETVLRALGEAMRAFAAAKPFVPATSGLDTALVVDVRDRFLWDWHSPESLRRGRDVFETLPLALYASGAAFDVLTEEDFRTCPSRYRTVFRLGDFLRTTEKLPLTGEAWAGILCARGVHLYAEPGSLVRRNGDLILFHVGTAGRHVLRLPKADAGKTFRELTRGRTYASSEIVVESTGPETWLFCARKAPSSACPVR